MDLQRGQVPVGLVPEPGVCLSSPCKELLWPQSSLGPGEGTSACHCLQLIRESARRRVRNNQHQAVGRLLPACEGPAVTKTRENSSRKCHTHLPPLQEKNEPLALEKEVCEPNEEATVYLWPEARLPLEWMSLVTVCVVPPQTDPWPDLCELSPVGSSLPGGGRARGALARVTGRSTV